MAKQELPVDFKDDVLQAEMAGKRKYRVIQNEDGTISLEDVTNYSQIGSDFGAAQMNATNMAVNESFDKNKVIDSLDDIAANESAGYAAGALAVRELNGKTDLQMIPGNGMRFNTQWSDNYAIVKGDILYINFLIENTNGSYYKENAPHTLCKIKKPKSVKIGNRLSLAGYALSSSGSARANSGQVSLYTGVQDRDDMEIVFLTTDSSTYKMNVTGAILLR